METMGPRAFSLMKQLDFVRENGTSEARRALEILSAAVRAMGLTPVEESFPVEWGQVLRAGLSAGPDCYPVTGYLRGASTPPEGITAPFAYIQSASPLDLVEAKGKIVLLNGTLTAQRYQAMAEAEVAGFITFTGSLLDQRDHSDLNRLDLRDWALQYGVLPGVNLRVEDALRLVRSAPREVTLTVVQECRREELSNLMVRLPGQDPRLPGMVLAAHYDTVPFSRGMYDNGAGVGLLMELLRRFRGCPPRHPMTFVWFAGEEIGLLGSKAYLARRPQAAGQTALMVNIDVAAPVLGEDFADVNADASLVHMVEYLAGEVGFPITARQRIYPSDSIPFVHAGIPSINFRRFGAPGAAFLHSRHDTLDYLGQENLSRTGEFIYTFCARLANSVRFPVPRAIPPETAQAVETYLCTNTHPPV